MDPIGVTCGTQFAESERPPERCPICEDERQFVGWAGQEWTTLEELRARHRLALKDEGDGLLGIGASRSSRSASGRSWCRREPAMARAATSCGTASA